MDVERHKDHRFTKAIDQLYKHGILLSVSPLSGEFETDWYECVFKKRKNVNKVPGNSEHLNIHLNNFSSFRFLYFG